MTLSTDRQAAPAALRAAKKVWWLTAVSPSRRPKALQAAARQRMTVHKKLKAAEGR